MSSCSGFPEFFAHATLFCCPAHTVFGSPSPGHGKEDLCTVLPAGTNKAPGTHERQWLGRNLALYAGCITNCIFGGFGTVDMRLKWLFCEVCGLQALFFWPSLRCSCSRSGQLCSGYFASSERHGHVPAKRKPNKASLQMDKTLGVHKIYQNRQTLSLFLGGCFVFRGAVWLIYNGRYFFCSQISVRFAKL